MPLSESEVLENDDVGGGQKGAGVWEEPVFADLAEGVDAFLEGHLHGVEVIGGNKLERESVDELQVLPGSRRTGSSSSGMFNTLCRICINC